MTRTGSTTRVPWADCAFLFGAVFASSLPYVFRLGFYSDDWATLAIFSRLGILKGMRQVLNTDVAMRSRPVQLAYLALNFKAFGLHPVPYHLVASVLLGIAAVCLYLAATESTVPRSTAFAISLIFGLLPHYSTDAMQIALNDWSVDVVSANLRFDDTGVATMMYDAPEGNYPYGSRLFTFNSQKNILAPLPSKQAALTYLRLLNPTGDSGCPHAYEGIGEKLF